MSDMAIHGSGNAYPAEQAQAMGKLPQIIDVKTGAGTDRAGLLVTTTGGADGPRAVDGVDGLLTPSQVEDLEALLELLGLGGEDAKNATLQTVLKAIQSAIKQQSVTVTSCTTAISDYDVTRLEALKKAMEGSDDPNAKKIIDNIDRMMVLKQEIEDLANNQGMTYDGKFESHGKSAPSNPNWELNTRVREMGDRIADIRYYKAHMGDAKMDSLLDSLAPAMKTAVKDLLAAYDKTSGWGVQVNIAYSKMSVSTLSSFTHFLSSPDLKLPAQISKDALLQVLKEIAESLGADATAEQIAEKLEEKMQEILAQLNDVASEMPVQA